MDYVTVVDARMGRGKSSAAIRYMNQYKHEKRFLYITPFLTEVRRVCECCDFDEPDSDFTTKSNMLKEHVRAGHNIAATHSLFYLLDNSALDLLHSKHYSLIIDESIEAIGKAHVTQSDYENMMENFADECDDGRIVWRDPNYTGVYHKYKALADTGWLYHQDTALLSIVNPEVFNAFDDVIMLTYMIDGQYQKAYLNFYGFPYKLIGVEQDEYGFYFTEHPDNPPPTDFRQLITVVDSQRMNNIGRSPTALSKNWYSRRGYSSREIAELRKNMTNYFIHIADGDKGSRLWTCYKEDRDKLINKNGRFRPNFLQVNARATNEYKDRTNLAYMVNRYADPNLLLFFGARGCVIDENQFALSYMLQWIWRSAIRENRPITLYLPSKRMRDLLNDWMDKENGRGGCIA